MTESWSYFLTKIERLEFDDTTGLTDPFSVTFKVVGPCTEGQIELFVPPVEDEADVVSTAMHGLHVALAALARETEVRRMSEADVTRN